MHTFCAPLSALYYTHWAFKIDNATLSGVYHKHVTFICAVCHQLGRDVTIRLVTVFTLARLDYCNVILVVSWCPVHISAAAVSPSCGNTYWSRVLHCVNSTGFQSLRGYSVSCVCCYTTHLSATLRLCGIRHSCLRQSLAFCRAQLFDWWETVTSTCDERWRASFLHCCIVRI